MGVDRGSAGYEEDFLRLLNNRAPKTRERGFVAFVHGPVGLAPFQRLCFPDKQTYNHCVTARYRATLSELPGQPGRVPGPLFAQFVEDVVNRRTSNIFKLWLEMAAKTHRPKGAADTGRTVGVFEPALTDKKWRRIRRSLRSLGDKPLTSPVPVFSVLSEILSVGERLVLFCELHGAPNDTTLEDIGFSHAFIETLHDQPERLGLVFSGVPEGLSLESELGDHFRAFHVPPDYDKNEARQEQQPLANDQPIGSDQLMIGSEVNALADAMLSSSVSPPLVVGVLGGWGSGKSFVINLLKQRMAAIRRTDLTDPSVRDNWFYCGHPYLVEMNAWTYAKSNLWASLMERVFFDLDRQLTLEQTLASAKVDLRQGVDIWELIASLAPEQLAALETDLGQEALEKRFRDWRIGKPTGRSIWTELEKLHKEALTSLGAAREELEAMRVSTAEARRAKEASLRAIALAEERRIEKALATLHRDGQADIDSRAASIRRDRTAIDATVETETERHARLAALRAVMGSLAGILGKAVKDAAPADDATLESIPTNVRQIADQVGGFKRWLLGQSVGSVLFLLVSLGSAAALVRADVQYWLTEVGTLIGSVGGLLASLVTVLSNINSKLSGAQVEFDRRIEEERQQSEARSKARRDELLKKLAPLEEAIEKQSSELAETLKTEREKGRLELEQRQRTSEDALAALEAEHRQTIEPLETTVEGHVRRAGIPAQGKSLHDVVTARVASGYYDKRLGLLHQIQQDLQELTDALMRPGKGIDPELFPRGTPRIVLVIDDLDRCPPHRVVEVLEAAQLLVKTELFVVVLAMDVRYVTRALEKKYEGILTTDGDPSGLDYIEKIVQIPYRVRPIAPDAMPGYLRSQMEVRRTPSEHESGGDGEGVFAGSGHPAVISGPLTRVNVALPPEIQTFDEEELKLLQTCALAVQISPRSTKRLVNVLKLIKIIWYRRGWDEPDVPVKRAIVLLLALSAAYPEVMRRLLLELERELYGRRRRVRLVGVLTKLIDKWSERSSHKLDWKAVERLVKTEVLLGRSVTLDALTLTNVEIVRSFSFVGEVDRPEDQETHQLGVDIRSPVTVATAEES